MCGGPSIQQRQRQQHDRGQQNLPEHQLKRRGDPRVRAHVQNADRPAEGGEQDQRIAEHGVAVAPIEGQRVEHQRQPGNADADAGRAPRGDALAQEQPRARHDPQRRRVAQHHRAPGRDELQADGHQRGEGHHVQQRDVEDDGDVAALRHDQVPRASSRPSSATPAMAERIVGGPQRRRLSDDRLGHRPGDAPGEHHDRKQQDRRAPGQGLAHWVIVGWVSAGTTTDVLSQPRSARNPTRPTFRRR